MTKFSKLTSLCLALLLMICCLALSSCHKAEPSDAAIGTTTTGRQDGTTTALQANTDADTDTPDADEDLIVEIETHGTTKPSGGVTVSTTTKSTTRSTGSVTVSTTESTVKPSDNTTPSKVPQSTQSSENAQSSATTTSSTTSTTRTKRTTRTTQDGWTPDVGK